MNKLKVNLSSSFIFRTKCKKCGTIPVYHVQMNKMFHYDYNESKKSSDFFKKFYKKISPNYFKLDFVSLSKMQFYNHSTNYKTFCPKLYKNRDINNGSNIIEYLMCKCRDTWWVISEKSSESRLEIKNRKSRYHYDF